MEQEEEFKKDKIFDNNFSETEIEINSQPLQIDGSFKEICFDEKPLQFLSLPFLSYLPPFPVWDC